MPLGDDFKVQNEHGSKLFKWISSTKVVPTEFCASHGTSTC
jgi:hypothetical protein